MTEFLFWKDAYLTKFNAKVIEIKDNNIILDKTAFYPQSGNQVCDKGYLKKKEKRYTVEYVFKEGEKVYHQINSKSVHDFSIGETLTGNIEWKYRYGIMRAHSSQHLLSAIIKNKFDIDTIHANILYEEVMLQICHEISESQLKVCLQELNRISIIENHNFKTHINSKEDLSKYSDKLRGIIPHNDKIRLVEVPGYDLICCGGTHIKNSTEIGPIFIYEFKKGTDIKYVLGQKALELYSQLNIDLISSSALLGISYSDFFPTIERQNRDYNELGQNYIKAASNLLDYISNYPNLQVKDCSFGVLELDVEFKYLQKQFKEFPEKYALIILKPENKVIIISNSEKIKANDLLNHLIQHYGGKGGGSPYSAQGALDSIPVDIPSLIKTLYK
jgi:Ser-tRNA(Ala) deacylase AlaX